MSLSEQNKDPIESEFFRRELAVAAIVRESIQNSLDASDGHGPVVVRFTHSGEEFALCPRKNREWLEGLPPHLLAAGLDVSSSLDQAMPFLAIEDFGTRGLMGDPQAARKSELGASGGNEDFFYFWRNVGISGKAGSERGSWGLGKAVYASSSRIRSMLGWTIRSGSPRSLLMGQAVLGIHEMMHDRRSVQHDAYGFYGQFGRRNEDPDFAMPTDDARVIAKFKEHFKLHREDQPGLSIVVPYPSEELCQGSCAGQFVLEVIRQYTYPILAGQLAVDIITPREEFHLDRDGLLASLDRVDWPDRHEKDLIKRIAILAMWAIDEASPVPLVRKDARGASWSDIEFPPDVLSELREKYNRQQPIAVRVPILVRPKGQQERLSHFDVNLQQDSAAKESAVAFVRQGLTLSEVTGPAAAGVVGMVVIEDDAIAQLLRAAENPAHTKWLVRSERLMKNYTGGPDRVRFVESAPKAILKRLMDTGEEADTELLADLLPDPEPDPEADHPGQATGSKKGRKPAKPGPVPPPRPRPIEIHKLSDGFSMSRIQEVPLPSTRLLVEAAFDCVGANAFKMWEAFDFAVDKAPLEVVITGGTVEEQTANRVCVRIESDDFTLAVRGFPRTRDVVVRHRWLREQETQ